MIPASLHSAQPADWRAAWRDAVTDPAELLRLLDLPQLAARLAAAGGFPLRVPRGFVARMRRGDAADPLLRQVLPLDDEDRIVPGFGLDAVGDLAARGARGVLHKYHGRALLVATGACAIHCRYCFRRHFPYGEEAAAANGWQSALDYMRGDPSIDEVLLSGGDPLSLSTPKLADLTDALRTVPHLRRLRIHTRLPVVLPERIDAALLDWFGALPWPVVLVIHANHANELDDSVAAALAALARRGVRLYNQAVLLRGVNDDEDALVDLSTRLFELGVQPYYLHQLDRVAGTAHFEVDDVRALALVERVRARLPGYLVPQLVREVPGAASKTPI
ncbi:EF-P beta-lysylation protein EpmB [Chiayiivirga flava]|uniref:L-lysine 2,3-aminomutase n=2 Tax=Chiayiivirga flava TaxID=659595 RepID=A0A7W8D2P7_9GAMM|nr:EF-P beta-lysylation protein EpmB [Chiayiivirga flava]MBB5206816.1 EF-P beta-lysylation protein EpmB [Chiayiivirga flava]